MLVVTQIWLNCTRNVRIDCIEMDQLEAKVSISGVLSVRSQRISLFQAWSELLLAWF